MAVAAAPNNWLRMEVEEEEEAVAPAVQQPWRLGRRNQRPVMALWRRWREERS